MSNKEVTESNANVTVVSEDFGLMGADMLSLIMTETASMPSIMMYDKSKSMDLEDLVNLSAGAHKSLTDILNLEVTLEGFGLVKLQFIDEDGVIGDYIRYILVTDQGAFTTTSSFIGRTLAMLYQVKAFEPKVKFIQVDKGENRRFMMELVKSKK